MSQIRDWKIYRDTYFQAPTWLFAKVVTHEDYNRVLDGQPQRRSLPQKILRHLLWFWPRIGAASVWADASIGGPLGPQNYLRYEPSRLVTKILEVVPRDRSLLELGCNVGSDLDLLRKAGYYRLEGMDAGREALQMFQDTFPETFALVSPKRDLFQHYLLQAPDKSVDYVYSNGATIELVHPSFPIVREICRVARLGILLDLSERVNGFPRDYVAQFRNCGFPMWYTDRETDPHPSSQIFIFLNKHLNSPQ